MSKRTPPDPSGTDRGVRLQKFLAHAGVCSRREGESLITAGRVAVNGRIVRELGTRVDPGSDSIVVDGRQVHAEAPVVLLMNKPDGVVCAAKGVTDERGRKTVLALVRDVPERVYPVGRLDYHTRGALVLTNDGDLAAGLTHPRHKVPKTYHVKFQGALELHDLEQLHQGVVLDDGTRTRPAVDLCVIRETHTNTWVQITVVQGLYRQIRRMGEAIGHPVLKLIRVAIGDLTLEGLPEGAYRRLRPNEIHELRERAGLVAQTPSGRRARKSRKRSPRR